jgi:hypothetical protein
VLDAAYLYYYATETAFEPQAEESGALKRRLEDLIKDALIIADQAKFDVFNALTLMDNVPSLEQLKVRRFPNYGYPKELKSVRIVRSWRRAAKLLPLQLANRPTCWNGRQRRRSAWKRRRCCHDLIAEYEAARCETPIAEPKRPLL